jgi:DNA-binding NtrC family response regulator
MSESEKKQRTILVVDNFNAETNVVVDILEAADFIVLHANMGYSALRVAASYPGGIDLLLSDLKMPGMSGPDLSAAMKESRPEMHVMFATSFPSGELLVLNYGWAFIDKQFVAAKLVEMINVVLQTPDQSQGSHQYTTRLMSGEE